MTHATHDVSGELRDAIGRFAVTAGHKQDHSSGMKVVASGSGAMSDAEYEARVKRVEQAVGAAVPKHSTDVQFTTADGAWRPERDRVHREIADAVYAKASAGVPKEGKAIIAGGLGGAGKSTVLRDHAGVDASKFVTINPDDIKEELAARGMIPHVPGHEDLSPMERAALVHEESSRIAKLIANKALAEKRNLIYDITLSSKSGAATRIDGLQRAGYQQIDGVFVDIPVEASVTRAMSRYRRGVDQFNAGKGHGGRFVPPSIIRAQGTPGSGPTVNRQVFDEMRDQFHNWAVYDNSAASPTRVAQHGTVGG